MDNFNFKCPKLQKTNLIQKLHTLPNIQINSFVRSYMDKAHQPLLFMSTDCCNLTSKIDN